MPSERRAAVLLVATTAIWGSTFPTMKLADQAIHRNLQDTWAEAGLFFLGLRFLLGGALFAAIFPRAARALTRRIFVDSLWVALPGIAGIALQFVALRAGSSAMVAFITSLTIVTVPLIGRLVFNERLPRSLGAGALLALAGVFILTNPVGGGFGRDEILAGIGTLLFGLQIHLINRYTRRHDPGAMTFGVFLHFAWVSAALLALTPQGRAMMQPAFLSGVLGPGPDGPWWRQYAMAWILPYHAGIATVVAFGIALRYQRDVPATRAAVIYCLEPVWTVVIAWGFREPVTLLQIAGGAVVIAGNLVCELWRPPPREPAVPEAAALPAAKAPPPPVP